MRTQSLRLALVGVLAAGIAVLAAAPASATTSECVRVRDAQGNTITQVCIPLP